MLTFEAYSAGQARADVDLSGAYVFAQDGIPVRADLVARGSQIDCMKNSPGPAGLAVMWDVGENGKYLLSTTRLRDRKKPYNLNLELARARMMRLYQKREDWSLFDRDEAKECNEEFDKIRGVFIEALQLDVTDPPGASQLADEALNEAMLFGEKMALLQARLILRRRTSGRRIPFGTSVSVDDDVQAMEKRIVGTMDFLSVPTPWRLCEPNEGKASFEQIDKWMNFAARQSLAVHAGPLVSFAPEELPEWAFLRQNGDFATLRSMISNQVDRVVKRYAKHVRLWNVAAGLHCVNSFNLNFEQISELTRLVCKQVKTLAPQSQILLDMPLPWGEYYARNQRTVPPLLFADMAYQNDIKFDAFGLHIEMGVPADGYFVRDLLEIGARLDEFSPYGKAIHITACQVPSSDKPDPLAGWGLGEDITRAGRWHQPWSPRLQAEWLQAIYRLAMGRSAVESICWGDMGDLGGHYLPNGGLLDAHCKGKLAYRELRDLRSGKRKHSHGHHHHHHDAEEQ